MARRVAWKEAAWRELESAAIFIAQGSPLYASALIREARDAARSLRHFAMRGRVVPEIGKDVVREIFVKSYRLIYHVREDQVVVIAFLHGARRFPPGIAKRP